MRWKPNKFTGRHALLWFVLFFGVIATVNGVMIWFALNAGGNAGGGA